MSTAVGAPKAASLAERYRAVRSWSERLAAPLSPEDQTVQVEWFASPTKWHLAHTTWFFETFVLLPAGNGYRPFHPAYRDFWNSYYHTVSEQIPQAIRGHYSRPTVAEVMAYRQHVDAAMLDYLQEQKAATEPVVMLGLNHEQQHQELLLTDIKFALAQNPLGPVYEPKLLPVSNDVAPLYWRQQDGAWWTFTLAGRREIDRAEPVCHLSYFEADAFARWAGARLPTEFEWELAAGKVTRTGNFAESERFQPSPVNTAQMLGGVWEWTASAYAPYPGYRTAAGALGEYNGKFMCNQMVLRGGSCATPQDHVRPTYRNFFPPELRWQFMGARLARDVPP